MKQFDKYYLFIEKGLQLVKPGGFIGYIVPSKFMKLGSAKKLRSFLLTHKAIQEITSFGANQVFAHKSNYTCILILSATPHDSFNYYMVDNLPQWLGEKHLVSPANTILHQDLSEDVWALYPKQLEPVYKKLIENTVPLKQIAPEAVANGIQTSSTEIFIHEPQREDSRYIYFNFGNRTWQIEKEVTQPYFRTDERMYTYRYVQPNSFVIYPYEKGEGKPKIIPLNIFEKKFPCAFQFLSTFKEKLLKRKVDAYASKQPEWYCYGRQQALTMGEIPEKIIVGILSKGEKYPIDKNHTIISAGGTAGYCYISLPKDCPYSLYYIQAVLNSKYVEWIAYLRGEIFQNGYIAHGTKILPNLPVPPIDFNNAKQKSLHDNITNCQKTMMDIYEKIDNSYADQRTQLRLRNKFDLRQEEMRGLLRELFNLRELDGLVPEIGDLYATNL